MKDSYFKIVLTALAEKIDRLCGEVFIRDMRIEKLEEENKMLIVDNEKLKKDNEALREALDVAKKVIFEEDSEDA